MQFKAIAALAAAVLTSVFATATGASPARAVPIQELTLVEEDAGNLSDVEPVGYRYGGGGYYGGGHYGGGGYYGGGHYGGGGYYGGGHYHGGGYYGGGHYHGGGYYGGGHYGGGHYYGGGRW
ncbi:MAG: hypothetical protein ABI134_13785 [Byssovorax sp.]